MKKLNILFLLLLATLFTSCEEMIVIDLRSIEPKLVIEADLPEGQLCTVKLSKTQDFYDQDPYATVSGATVILTNDLGETETLSEILVSAGNYQSKDMRGEVGRTYHLKVTSENKTYTASSTMPAPVAIDSLRFYYFGENFDFYSPRVYFTDPEGIDNYYSFVLTVNSKVMKDKDLAYDKYRDGKPIVKPIQYQAPDKDHLKMGDEVSIEMRSIDQGVFDFYLSMYSVASGGAVNPTSNIKGGALGLFNAYSKTSATETMSDATIVSQ